MPVVVAALYRFTPLADVAALRAPIQQICDDAGLCGTLLLAPEGINGTIAGTRAGIDTALAGIRATLGIDDLEYKESSAPAPPFYRMKVRLKKEIVTMGEPDIDPNETVGAYVDPKDWNALIADPDVILIDTRNDYEVEIGTFEGAIDPKTASFRDFPAWFRQQQESDPDAVKGKKIAMFCTGGIRCEKATAFVKQQGIDDVYHLKGGILKYLETVPEPDSLWRGECFVFDQRVSVGHGLAPGRYELCHACRTPIGEADKQNPKYEPGVSCAHCYDARDAEQKQRYKERQHQVTLAEQRGEAHIGKAFGPDTSNNTEHHD
ncbi:MAG: rhodanese-related sulfurtransferase [Alphaproteobacteria bacterium]